LLPVIHTLDEQQVLENIMQK